MERWQAKLLALIGSFVLPLIVTMLPYKVSGYVSKKGKKGKLVLSYLMCFGGGIFFGTYLLHMGPEVHLLLNTALLIPYGIHYPLTDLFVGIGFFLVIFSEKFVLKWNKKRTRSRSIREEASMAMAMAAKADAEAGLAKTRSGVTNGFCCAECAAGKPCPNMCGSDSDPVGFIELVMEGEGSHGNGLHGNGDGNGVGCRPTNEGDYSACNTIGGLVVLPEPSNEEDEQHLHQHHHHSTRSIILIIALSMHRIFEGMTIGLQGSVHNIWSLFLAVMCHELVIGFSLGLQLVKSRLSLRQLSITSFVCSVIMPVGVAIGIVLTELGGEDGKLAMANGILQAIAMGTFIYVTFFEILQEEVDPNDTSIGKIVFIFAGFVMMALLDLIPEETPVAAMKMAQESLLGNDSAMATTQPTALADVSLPL